MSAPLIDLDLLLKLRLVVARFGEMDLAKWWNTKGQLGRLGTAASLCGGKYDWAHLAMHLWPERVVPKCVKDRSFAISHGLEDVFWIEGSDGKWNARKTPTRSLDELVRECTTPAVKSALKSLLEAPSAVGAVKKTKTKTKKGKANA